MRVVHRHLLLLLHYSSYWWASQRAEHCPSPKHFWSTSVAAVAPVARHWTTTWTPKMSRGLRAIQIKTPYQANLTLLACRLAFGGGGAGHVRCGGNGGAAPLPFVACDVTFSTFGVDPPTPPLPPIVTDPLPMWCFSCSFNALTLFTEAAEFSVFVVGVLRGICGKFWLDTLRSGGGGGLFGGGRGGGATVGRPGRP